MGSFASPSPSPLVLAGLALSVAMVPDTICAQESTAPTQPIAFSHKLHAGTLQLACSECHKLPEPGDRAGMPAETFCMQCHLSVAADSPAIARLRQYVATGEPTPWAQIYTLPDFVYFSHKAHVQSAKLECSACHGAVEKQDVLVREQPTSMQWCMDCHRKMKASVECNLCHSPG